MSLLKQLDPVGPLQLAQVELQGVHSQLLLLAYVNGGHFEAYTHLEFDKYPVVTLQLEH